MQKEKLMLADFASHPFSYAEADERRIVAYSDTEAEYRW